MLPIFIILNACLFIFISGYIVYLLVKPRNPFLFSWIWFNIWIGIYEVYIVWNRKTLQTYKEGCGKTDFWGKRNEKREFWLDTWSEYACFADKRYYNPNDFVHWIEFGNAVIVLLLLCSYSLGLFSVVYLLLLIQAYHCVIYFLSLIQNKEYKYCYIYKRIIYLFISALWIIIPICLLIKIRRQIGIKWET